MAITWWKSFENTPWFRRNKLKLKRLIGKEPKLDIETGFDLVTVGDWSLVDHILKPGDVVYSMGICDDIAFELALIQRYQVELFAFDPTPYSVKWIARQQLPDNLHFYPWAASGEDGQFLLYPRIDKRGQASEVMFTFHTEAQDRTDGVQVDAYRLESITQKLGHDRIDLLKMDVEGAEYDVLKGLVSSSVRPKMILVEFHHRFSGVGKAATEQAVSDLRALGYVIASVSITGRELCFIRKEDVASREAA
ncbi:MAG: hypothetical protein C9356_18665 [Oleiphilus sp.]|nr:MAG: hypothetical protein C9356_18665 [Oleiphilus sp.]